MKSGRREDKAVLCPFYTEEASQIIFCEGIEPDTTVHVAFSSKALKSNFKHRFCESQRYEKCRIARMLALKYEEEEKENGGDR